MQFMRVIEIDKRSGSKVGGASKFFKGWRVGIKEILRSQEWAAGAKILVKNILMPTLGFSIFL